MQWLMRYSEVVSLLVEAPEGSHTSVVVLAGLGQEGKRGHRTLLTIEPLPNSMPRADACARTVAHVPANPVLRYMDTTNARAAYGGIARRFRRMSGCAVVGCLPPTTRAQE